MSRKFQEKNKDLVKLGIITSEIAWDKKALRKGKPTLNKDYEFYGRIDKGTRAYWIGVGISAALHGDSETLLNAPNKRLSQSAVNGYVQDNKKDISRKVFYSKTNKN